MKLILHPSSTELKCRSSLWCSWKKGSVRLLLDDTYSSGACLILACSHTKIQQVSSTALCTRMHFAVGCGLLQWHVFLRLFTIYLGKTGWSTVVVNGMCEILNGNYHWDVLVPFPRLFFGR